MELQSRKAKLQQKILFNLPKRRLASLCAAVGSFLRLGGEGGGNETVMRLGFFVFFPRAVED